MLTQSMAERLHALGLLAMVAEWHRQQTDPDSLALSFDERLGLLADREWDARQNRP